MDASDLLKRAACLVDEVRKCRPLIYSITNDVTITFLANGILALGGAPIMSSSTKEAGEIARQAQGVLINMGTPHNRSFKAMTAACRMARKHRIPAVFDPVGAGFTAYRNRIVHTLLLRHPFAIIKGNAAEIDYLAGKGRGARGVDAVSLDNDPVEAALLSASSFKTVTAVTGAEDIVSNGIRSYRIKGGTPLCGKLTGTGCLAGALCALYLSQAASPVEAAVTALLVIKTASQEAACNAAGTGSFYTALLDSLTTLRGETLLKKGNLYEA
ncbi:MAG TPA: hydroxyethylthiazole kinase [Firmicutes bacterium]|nr:hydroxyethylthiazole kinase [Bacillota bacterium]